MNYKESPIFQRKIAYLIINAQVFPITKNITKIGRQLDNDLVIQDLLISRYHAEIFCKNNSYFIRDLNSTGGTFLNNNQIIESPLFSNDLILIANTPIMFIIEENTNIREAMSKATGSLGKIEEEDIESDKDQKTTPQKRS